MEEEVVFQPRHEIVKFILQSNPSLIRGNQAVEVDIPMPVQLQRISLHEAQTQTSSSKEKLVDDGSTSKKYALLSLDEYQIIRTGEEHCLKEYFSDDDDDDDEDRSSSSPSPVHIEDNLNNNASTILRQSPSDLSKTFLLDDATHLSAALAQSTSSHISHSRYVSQSQSHPIATQNDDEDDELDQLVASTFTPAPPTEEKNLPSIRQFVREAVQSCQENLHLVAQLLEHLPAGSSRSPLSFERLHRRKVRRTDCLLQMPSSIKGLQYSPSTSVQTD